MARRRKPARRRNRRKKKNNRLAWFILLLVIFGLALYQGWLWLTGHLSEKAAHFMQLIVDGDRLAAVAMLEEGHEAGLDEWIAFFQEPGNAFSGIMGARLTGFSGGRVSVVFRAGKQQHETPLDLSLRAWRWRLQAVPRIELLTGAFVRAEAGGSLRLYWQGSDLNVSLGAPLNLEHGAVVKTLLVGNTVLTVTPLEKITLSRLLRRDSAELEGELEGAYPVSRSCAVYRLAEDGVSAASISDLHVGRKDLSLYLDEGVVEAVTFTEDILPETIRVVLRRNFDHLDDDTLRHRWINLTGDTSFVLTDKRGGTGYRYEAGEELIIEPLREGLEITAADGSAMQFDHSRIFVETVGEGFLLLKSLRRDGWHNNPPAYRGVIEISNRDGQLVVVNEPTLEQYLYTVLPSEMPLSFGPEALKAQAVAARTYACMAVLSGRFSSFGAHVDDSVMSQVYNNIPEAPLSREAVDATAGEALFFEGAVADTLFFAASCGYTANANEVWQDAATGSFPGPPVPYLKAAAQIPGETVRLDTEENVRLFLERADWPAFDRESPYFRWRVEMSGAELEAAINQNLAERFSAQPDYVLTLDRGEFRSIEVPRNPIGRLRHIRVIERGAGGNIMVLELEGTNGVYRISKEYNIRSTLRPVQYLSGAAPVLLRCHDGGSIENYALLPSAFVGCDLVKDTEGYIAGMAITGGGNGHGVGMSQYGARGMAAAGFSYQEILEHFYPGTELRTFYIE